MAKGNRCKKKGLKNRLIGHLNFNYRLLLIVYQSINIDNTRRRKVRIDTTVIRLLQEKSS